MTEFRPALAFDVLARHGVRYVLIGGLAGDALGAPLVTDDLDLCHDRADDNLAALASALQELHATLRGAPSDVPFRLDARTLKAGDSFTFDTDAGKLDILATPAGIRRGYAELAVNAVEMEVLDGVRTLVCCLEDLIRMKAAAGRPKDLLALEVLGALRDEVEGRPEEPWEPPGSG